MLLLSGKRPERKAVMNNLSKTLTVSQEIAVTVAMLDRIAHCEKMHQLELEDNTGCDYWGNQVKALGEAYLILTGHPAREE